MTAPKNRTKLYVTRCPGNLYDAATFINKMNWADYVISMDCIMSNNTIIVLRMPTKMVHQLRRDDKGFVAEVNHDDCINSFEDGKG